MKVTRRDLLVWSAGAAAGLMVTPVPWKILDDVSIWSQNWPWIPQPKRGPVEIKQSACTLCPHGCGLKVRMSGGWPVGVAGLSTNPVSRGALCPLAFGAHQLNWHPQRLRTVLHRHHVSSWKDAQAAFAKASTEGPIVVMDGYPGRASSSVLESFAYKSGGSYRVVAGSELASLTPYENWTGAPASSLGYDFENARTIVSFGAPLLDGWGTPGRFSRLWAERAAGMDNPQMRLIQIDSTLTHTAARAWRWVQVREGSEAALAAGLARMLIEQELIPARTPTPSLALSDAAAQTGVSVDAMYELARMIIADSTVLVVARDNNPAIAALNVLLGAVGTRGGVVRISGKLQARYESAEAPITNARALLLDSSVPWDFVPKTDAEIFRFAAWNGGGNKADWLLPAPGFLEELTDVPTPPGSAVESYTIAPSLTKPGFETRSAAQLLASVDRTLDTTQAVIHQRCAEIFRSRKGSLNRAEAIPVSRVTSVEEFEKQLGEGAVWMGEPVPAKSLHCDLKEWPSNSAAEGSVDWARGWRVSVLPPLTSKLIVESTLREAPAGRNA